jgi:hypothetical protein
LVALAAAGNSEAGDIQAASGCLGWQRVTLIVGYTSHSEKKHQYYTYCIYPTFACTGGPNKLMVVSG